MRRVIIFFLFLVTKITFAQVDFSDSWEDFFSYNNVKDFVKIDETIYALSDNAVFTYDITTQTTQKISSVQGLSGETTSAIHFSRTTNRLVIGYENGLIEVVDEDGSITISADIVNFNQSGEKSINHIYENNGLLYLSTPFAVIEYDINRLEFGDTFFIGNNSTDLRINQITVFNDRIYAATEDGIFDADVNNQSLIDFNNWNQQLAGNNFTEITVFNNRLFAVFGSRLNEFVNNGLVLIRNFPQTIVGIKPSSNNLAVSLNESVFILDTNLNQVVQSTTSTEFDYNLNNAFAEDNELFLGTQQFGILATSFSNLNSFNEIHPDGPVSNDVFSLSAQDNHLWVAYGGYAFNFAPIQRRLGYSHYNGESWFTPNNDPNNPFPDFVDVTIDPNNPNRSFISGFGDTRNINTINVGGFFEVLDNEIVNFYNQSNSTLQDITSSDPGRVTIRVSGSTFDLRGDLWFTNIGVPNELLKLSGNTFSSFDISSVKPRNSFGLTEIVTDRSNNVWIGSRGDGVIVFNENGNRIRALNTTETQGSLPNLNVRTVAVDSDNRIWIGTISGLVVFNNASGVFDAKCSRYTA